MTPPPTIPDETPAADFARPLLERQLAELSDLAAIGMTIARSLGRTVTEAAEPGATPVDPVAITLAFSRVSRAIRLTFALQTTVIDKLRGVGRIEDYEAGLAAPAAPAVAKEDPRLRARKNDIAATVTGIIDELHKDDPDGEARECCIRAATERLTEAEDLGDILARPFNEIVEQICRDLGLSRRGPGSPLVHPDESRDPGFFSPPQRQPDTELARTSLEGSNAETENTWVPTSVGMNRGDEVAPSSPPAEPLPPPIPTLSPLQGKRASTPPPDPDALPGYPVGLPGELPPDRSRPRLPPRNYTYGWD